MKMKKHLLTLFLLGGVAAVLAAAPVRTVTLTKTAEDNPRIYFAGMPENPELSREVATFLKVCGWFDMGTRDRSDYTLELRRSGDLVAAELAIGGAPAGSWKFKNVGNARAAAKLIVDTLIENSFRELKVRSFCSSRIAFCAETKPGVRNIYLCDIDGGDVEQLTNFQSLCVEPCWNPNGSSVFYSKYGRSGIEVLETTVRKPRMSRIVSAFRGINTGAALSPDGRRLAVILSFDHMVDLYIMDLHTRKLARLTRGIAVEASPCWSPDGRTVAYVSDESGSPRIHLVDADGRNRRRLPAIGSDAVTPDWSGDGKIVFASRVGGSYTLGVFDLASGKCSRVTEAPGNWESPAWAADNRQVVCKRTWGGKSGLFVVDTKTGRVRELLSTRYPLSMPAWSPCAPIRK